MASAPRIIATASRFSAITARPQKYGSLYRPSTICESTRNYVDLRWAAYPRRQTLDVSQTMHAANTMFTTSRDHRPQGISSLCREVRSFQGTKYFTTSRGRLYAAKREDEKSTTGNEQQAKPQLPTDTAPTTPAIPVPEILKRLTPPVLHENIYTLPNLLTTTRVITAPIISYALLHSQPVLAFTLFAYSSITDLVDGYLARRYNSGTVLGSILDPFADKLLMTLTTITLYTIGIFPWWLTLIILGRDAGLLLSALYFRWISLPPPRTMTRYWDFSLPSAEVRPTEISKINTMLQFLLVADALLVPVLPGGLVEAWNLWGVLEGWMGLVAGTTVWSGLSYVFTRDAIRFIGKDRDGKSEDAGKETDVVEDKDVKDKEKEKK